MKLYHGTNAVFGVIDINKSKPSKDFGQAFYVSADRQQAKNQADNKVFFFGGEPVVLEYEFDESVLLNSELKIKTFQYYCLEWAQFVWDNRDDKRPVPYEHDFDIVYGPIANDTVGLQMREFRRSHKDLQGFLEGLHYYKGETFQYAFCSQRAIDLLIPIR